ncbi:CapA family protein [Shewanella chilikensis]|uniref:CapA family protein n=1 Tax=Shewanella chilikensis TaxID=558541 RepID=UPI001F357D0F|nr:CapA family protein [Shewanella chilikensis]MCE9786736.1 CapA family protein [Shewanella chilikensis]
MIFLGDVAHPFNNRPNWPLALREMGPLVVNLEGPICTYEQQVLSSAAILFNHPSVLEELEECNVVAACLANNHITDIADGVDSTLNHLNSKGILGFGAVVSKALDVVPKPVTYGGFEYVFLGFGWEVIQCEGYGNKKEGVVPLNKSNVITKVCQARSLYPNAKIICNFHWNYELELYPQPAHRELAMLAVDNGADLIIGHHPHIVGGIELYKNVPIVYSLGNWWLPQGVFFNGKIKYPEESYQQLAFEFRLDGSHKCHWYSYHPETHDLSYELVENLTSSQRVEALTPFSGMNSQEYYAWFKINRKKSKALPIYKSIDSVVSNKIKDFWIKVRHPLMLVAKRFLKVFRKHL